MNSSIPRPSAPARIKYLKVQNFRALREVEFKDLMPLTVLLGPNGSGKSTVFDVFAFYKIRGGTWETFERILRRHGYFKEGLQKVATARELGGRLDPKRCRSNSFLMFRDVLAEAVA